MRGERWPLLVLLVLFGHELVPTVRARQYPPADEPLPEPVPVPRWVFSLDRLPEPKGVDASWLQKQGDLSNFHLSSLWERASRDTRKVQTKTDIDWGDITSKIVFEAPRTWDDPLRRQEWKREDSLNLNVVGPIFLYGNFGAGAESQAQQDMKVTGKTGLGCKIALLSEGEVVLRSGPSVTYTDPLQRVREKSEWLLEVQARYPLLAGVGLEYQGSAAPALTPLDRDWINQDLHLAVPVGPGGKLQLGAKHRWENSTTQKPLSDGMQFYLGFEWVR